MDPGSGVGGTGQMGCESRAIESWSVDARAFTACGRRFGRRGTESCCPTAGAVSRRMKASPIQSARRGMSKRRDPLRRLRITVVGADREPGGFAELTSRGARAILPHTMCVETA